MIPSAPATRRSGGPGAIADRRPLLVDTAIALGLTALSILTLVAGAQDLGETDPLSVVLLLLQTLPLVVRRRFPLAVFGVTLSATIGHALLVTGPTLNSTLGSLVALYTVAERCDRRTSTVAVLVAGLAIGALIIGKVGVPRGLSGLVQSELSVLVVWVLGTWARERHQYIGTVEERAIRAEHEREARAERAVADERARIARELHDVVAHHVSVIVVQAGAALRAIDRRPEDARSALEAIDGSARQALTDMRRMLGVLKSPPAPAADDPSVIAGLDGALAPVPGLDRLGELLGRVRAAGVPVELSIVGERRGLDPGVELSAYRIVQESLTNALKHAPGTRARVELRYGADALEVRVTDDGSRGSRSRTLDHPDEPGHGLIGMRERVALFGGSFEAGPVGQGFRVTARLPVDASGGDGVAAAPGSAPFGALGS